MTKLKKYILENIKEYTNLHSIDIDENNININNTQYSFNYKEVKAAADMVCYLFFKGSNYRLVCDLGLCSNGELSVHIYDNKRYKEIYQTYLKF